jgi:hypothetical protein
MMCAVFVWGGGECGRVCMHLYCADMFLQLLGGDGAPWRRRIPGTEATIQVPGKRKRQTANRLPAR